jgi:hypothetical protein
VEQSGGCNKKSKGDEMKFILKALVIFLVVSMSWFGGGNRVMAQAAFNISPATVSNTYSGTITLQITNLTAGDTVVVQKFLDLNTNSIADAGDYLVQQFKLTDGRAGMVVGGVTNINVPGDTDGTANGRITAQLNFHNGDFVQNIAGQYILVLSSTSGSFAPVTNYFTVTNLPYAQQITGIVMATSVVVPNAVVLLFPAPRGGNHGPGTPVAGTVADNSGNYAFQVPPGTYVPMAFCSNCVSDYSASPIVTLGSGQSITTNLALTTATASISGQAVDASNPSIGLPGVFMPAMNDSGFIAIGFSDTNGNFNMRVGSGQWNLGSDDSGLIVHGYVGYNNGTNVAAGATGVVGPFFKATALFYGSVKDNSGNPMPGIDVNANDNNYNVFQSDGYTDANGKYVVGVLGGLGDSDPWQVQVSNGGDSGNPANYIYTQPQFDQNGGTNLVAGQALKVGFTAVLSTNSISGSLKDDSGNPIASVGVWADATISGANYNQGADTDSNGNYSLNVANGTWTVGVNSGGGGDSLSGNYLAPTNQSVVISSNNATVNFTAILATNHITGNVKASGTNIVGVGVGASATIGGVDYMQYADTDTNGDYSLNVANGIWSVGLNPSNGGDSLDSILGIGTYQNPAGQSVTISNGDGTANFNVLPNSGSGQISGYVIDAAGHPVGGATVSANDGVGDNYSTSTADSGFYSFNVGNGNWDVTVDCSYLNALGYQCVSGQNVNVPENNGMVNFLVEFLQTQTIVLTSDADTLAASKNDESALDTGDTSGLTFQPVIVGSYGTYTPVPPQSAEGAEVVQIPPADGENGFFKMTFTLPPGFSRIQLAGAANVDDYGRAFLNGHPLTPSLTSVTAAPITEEGNTTFSTTNADWFVPGTNELLVSDWNTGGPSGAAFYAVVSFIPVPSLGSVDTSSSGQFRFLLNGTANQNYTLQVSTDLSSTNWTTLYTTNNPEAGTFLLTDPNATNQQRFYRILVGP